MNDFDDVLSDPDWRQPFIVTRSLVTVDTSGAGVTLPASNESASGVVQPMSPELLAQYEGEGERLGGGIVIYTTTQLYPGEATRAADLVTWQGSVYRVNTCDVWAQFGCFYKATALRLQGMEGATI